MAQRTTIPIKTITLAVTVAIGAAGCMQLDVYRRLPNGSWSMTIDMLNSDAPQAAR